MLSPRLNGPGRAVPSSRGLWSPASPFRSQPQMKSSRALLTIAATLALSYSTNAFAQARPGAPPAAPAGGGAKAGKEADLLPAEPAVSQHTGTFNGKTVSYTTEAGWIPIRDDGKVVA